MVQLKRVVTLIWLLCLQTICAINVDWESEDSIKAAASQVAWDMMSYYKGNLSGQIPGLLPGPYYWWEAGAMFGALINYWHYTNDTTYNDVTMQAMQFQVGPHNDYMPPNETASLGNDDQAFWGIAAMQAAEYNFPNPPDGDPSWLSLAQAVYNEQIGRWLPQYCGGGIQWQIYEITGYDLKNSISNGCLFQLAARLARYTNTQSYADWAEKIWDWMWAIGLIGPEYEVYDNSEALRQNCTVIDKDQWCYNAGVMLMGAATMYNYTNGSEIWYNRTQGLMDMIAQDYFPDGIMKDICEEYNACDVDQHSFKAYLARWMASSTQMAPWIYNTSITLLKSSAKAAAEQCSGSPNVNTGQSTGTICGLKWYLNGTWDGSNGVGQEMAALEVIIGTLVTPHQNVPLTNATGGTSIGNPSAGFNASNIPPGEIVAPPSDTERGAAWFLTVFVSLLALWTWWFLSSTTLERKGRHGPSVAGKKRRTLVKGKEKGALDSPSTGSASGAIGSDVSAGEVATPVEAYAMKDRASRVINLNNDGRPAVPPHILHNRTASMPLSPIVEGGTDYRRSAGMDRMDRRSVPIYRGGDLPT